jgi:alpha-galactosidase
MTTNIFSYFKRSKVTLSRVASAFLAAALTLGAGTSSCAAAQPPGSEARTPPMGWNSWNHFDEKVTDADVRAAADALVASGMRDAGYVYVNIDDSWEGDRDAKGNIQSNKKFPDMKALADYVHSKGLKIGIYSSPGPKTCAGYEGSYKHEEQDAKTYAEWGFDYLKYDQCSFGDIVRQEAGEDLAKASSMQRAAYEKMHEALMHTGRPIVYSFCQYGLYAVWKWGPESGANLWRTTGDIKDNWSQMSLIGFQQAGLERFAGPGHWNDPDMLEVGNGHMSTIEYRTHMSLWAMLAAPLLAGNDLSAMTQDALSILLNKDVIAIDQDRLGHQGYRVWAQGPLEIWERPLENGHKAIAFFNRGESPMSFPINVATLGIKSGAAFTDVWRQKVTILQNGSEILVPNHGVTLLRGK